MALQIGDVTYRNLQEQVAKNATDIASLQISYTALDGSVATIKVDLASAQAEVDNLELDLASLGNRVAANTAALDRLDVNNIVTADAELTVNKLIAGAGERKVQASPYEINSTALDPTSDTDIPTANLVGQAIREEIINIISNYTQNIVDELTASITIPEDVYPYGTLAILGGQTIKENDSLINNAPTSVEVVGFNLWDEEWELGTISNVTGKNGVSNNSIRGVNYIQVMPNTIYYFKTGNVASGELFFYDANKNYISSEYGGQGTFTTPSNCYFVRLRVGTTYGTTYNNDICINVSNTTLNGQYKSYESTTLFANVFAYVAAQAYDLGMSAGDVYNYVDFEAKKAYIRVASVDLGTLEWITVTGASGVTEFCSYYGIRNLVKKPETNDIIANISCSRYNAISAANTYAGYIGIAIRNDGAIMCDNTSNYPDAATFKTAMSGVMLNYELATPIEIDLSSVIDSNVIKTLQEGGVIYLVSDNNVDLPVSIKLYIHN